ncbi:Uncharacterized protein DAT39_011307 [Clarias magur]|uniref:Uncharacterized protein n=1 Tax=Clarias magur TaxID=1594786 RepID=A0A8J4X2R6_CLAMG|nr:Uncharacterized protein DAT39_011307 [Clarias magur]
MTGFRIECFILHYDSQTDCNNRPNFSNYTETCALLSTVQRLPLHATSPLQNIQLNLSSNFRTRVTPHTPGVGARTLIKRLSLRSSRQSAPDLVVHVTAHPHASSGLQLLVSWLLCDATSSGSTTRMHCPHISHISGGALPQALNCRDCELYKAPSCASTDMLGWLGGNEVTPTVENSNHSEQN